MLKFNFHGMLDVKEFEHLKTRDIVRDFFLAFLYFLIATWTSIMMRLPALCYKLVSVNGVAIALACYVAYKGSNASIPEIIATVATMGVGFSKSYFDQKSFETQNQSQGQGKQNQSPDESKLENQIIGSKN